MALVHIDNHAVAKYIFQVLDDCQIISANEIEDYSILNDLRLLYVSPIYNPVMIFEK